MGGFRWFGCSATPGARHLDDTIFAEHVCSLCFCFEISRPNDYSWYQRRRWKTSLRMSTWCHCKGPSDIHLGPDDSKPPPEDVEIFEIERQFRQEEMENFRTVERIISTRKREYGLDTIEYFCKWFTLPYSTVRRRRPTTFYQAHTVIVEYQARESRTTLPYKSAPYSQGDRSAYTKLAELPEYLQRSSGAWKDFQLTGLNWLANSWSSEDDVILADEVSSSSG